VECRAIVLMLVAVATSLVLVVVWETVFTPAVHLVEYPNTTVSAYCCNNGPK